MEEKEHITIGQLSLRQISLVKSVLSRKGFSFKNVKEDSLKEGYTTYGTLKTSNAIIVVRLSNHICSMKNWSERYKAKLKANPKLLKRMGRNIQDPYKERHFFSIVFNAFDYNPNDSGKWKAICNEYVFNPKEVEDNGSIAQIARDSSNLSNGQTISINGITPTERVAIKEKQKVVNKESKQYNTNMNKNKIRLTESQLHNMISESVKQVLSELDWKTYASAADKARDKRLNNKDDYDAYRNTEREDAFNDAASKALSKKYNLRDVETYGDKDNPKKRIVKRFGSTSFTSDRDGVDFNDGELHTFGDMSKHGYAFPRPKDWIDYVMDSPYWRNRSDKERKDAYQNNEMNYDIDAFNHGKYKYVKGKGWQLKK